MSKDGFTGKQVLLISAGTIILCHFVGFVMLWPRPIPEHATRLYFGQWLNVGRELRRSILDEQRAQREHDRELKRLESERDPAAPPGVWNAFPNKLRTPIEEDFQNSGAWLVIRSGPALPGWWYGIGKPKGSCIRGSLYTNQGDSDPWLYVCGGSGKWVAR